MKKAKKTNVLFVTSEAVPYVKTGGLGDVAGTLPQALVDKDVDVRVALPEYRQVKAFCRKRNEAPSREVKVKTFLAGKYHEGRVHEYPFPENPAIIVYTVENDHFYDRAGLYGEGDKGYHDNAARYVFFVKAVIELIKTLFEEDGWVPDVLHLHDWQAALLALYVKEVYASMQPFDRMGVIFTIHNFAYQGVSWALDYPLLGVSWEYFTPELLEFHKQVNFMKAGLLYSDIITTVSKTYAKEIQKEPLGAGLSGLAKKMRKKLFGVINGADYATWSPERDTLLPQTYTKDDLSGKHACKRALCDRVGFTYDERVPVLGFVGRLAGQKGIDLLTNALDDLLTRDVLVVILGTGEERYEKTLCEFAKRYPERLSVTIDFSEEYAHLIEAGSDMFLMPSFYEPCGLNQLYSMRYGTVPVVHATGGLADTVIDYDRDKERGTGFSFSTYRARAFLDAIDRACARFNENDAWPRIMRTGMETEYTWDASADEYVALYGKAIRKAKRENAGRTAR